MAKYPSTSYLVALPEKNSPNSIGDKDSKKRKVSERMDGTIDLSSTTEELHFSKYIAQVYVRSMFKSNN